MDYNILAWIIFFIWFALVVHGIHQRFDGIAKSQKILAAGLDTVLEKIEASEESSADALKDENI